MNEVTNSFLELLATQINRNYWSAEKYFAPNLRFHEVCRNVLIWIMGDYHTLKVFFLDWVLSRGSFHPFWFLICCYYYWVSCWSTKTLVFIFRRNRWICSEAKRFRLFCHIFETKLHCSSDIHFLKHYYILYTRVQKFNHPISKVLQWLAW